MRRVVQEHWDTYNVLVLHKARHAEAGPLPASSALVALVGNPSDAGLIPGVTVGEITGPTTTKPGSPGLHLVSETEAPRPPVPANAAGTKGGTEQASVADKIAKNAMRSHARDAAERRLRPNISHWWRIDSKPLAAEAGSRAPSSEYEAALPPDKITDLAGVAKRLRSLWHLANTLTARWMGRRDGRPRSRLGSPLLGLICMVFDLGWFAIKLIETIYWVCAVLLVALLVGPLLVLRVILTHVVGIIVVLVVMIGLALVGSHYMTTDLAGEAAPQSRQAPMERR